MAITAQGGIFSFGPQPAKGTVAPVFHRHRATNVDLGVQDDVRLGQAEVGGLPVPTFPYKAGYVIGGGASLQPRMENSFGWLLYGALGRLASSSAVVGQTGAFDHKFTMTADGLTVPWISARKYIPPKDGDLYTDLGETYKDLKVLGLAFQMGSDTPLNARVDALGCDFELDDGGNSWTYNADFEDWESIPVACTTGGFIKVDGTELPVVQATFQWQNMPLDIRQEKVIGSPKLDDVTIVSRQLGVNLVVKYNNSELYRKVLTGSNSGIAWTEKPFTAPIDILTQSSVNMPGLTAPFSLRAQATEVQLQMQTIELGAGQAVFMRFQGVALDVPGSDYASFTLRNKQTTYAWPT